MGKAQDYLNGILKYDPFDYFYYKTEEEALDALIHSHKNQRDIIGDETTLRMHLGQHHHFLAWIRRKIDAKAWKEIGKKI